VPSREAQLLLDRSSSALSPILAWLRMPSAFISRHSFRRFFSAISEFPLPAGTMAEFSSAATAFGKNSTLATNPAFASCSCNSKTFVIHWPRTRAIHSTARNPSAGCRSTFLKTSHASIPCSIPTTSTNRYSRKPLGVTAFLTCCASRARRLAILELKATENIDLPLQAADYWPHSPPSGARRHRSLRLFPWHRTSTRSADCVYHRPRSPISSDNRFAAPPHHARDGNRANWALGKLAPGHPR
jgi:hypothetical protein